VLKLLAIQLAGNALDAFSAQAVCVCVDAVDALNAQGVCVCLF
jgi:hypothetical protein